MLAHNKPKWPEPKQTLCCCILWSTFWFYLTLKSILLELGTIWQQPPAWKMKWRRGFRLWCANVSNKTQLRCHECHPFNMTIQLTIPHQQKTTNDDVMPGSCSTVAATIFTYGIHVPKPYLQQNDWSQQTTKNNVLKLSVPNLQAAVWDPRNGRLVAMQWMSCHVK